MVTNLNKYRLTITICSLLLTIFGVYMVMDSSLVWAKYLYDDSLYFFKRQLIYAIIGIIAFIIGNRISITFLQKAGKYLLIISIILLIIVIIPGVGISKNGSTSWLGFSFLSFQPSEFFKLAIIIFFSNYLSENYSKSRKFVYVLPLLLISGLGLALIMLQPDFGTCMVIIITLFCLLFASKISQKWFILMGLIALFGIVILIFSASYRLERITAYIDPFSDPLGSGFQIIQSLYALGPGGISGKGINGSIQKHYYLPEPQTDFIFAIIIEEFGLIGGLIVIGLYFLIFYSSYKIIIAQEDLFKSYLFLGLIGIFLIQVIINLGVVIGLLPVTGITLPLISYGGSSLIVILFSLGIIVGKKR